MERREFLRNVIGGAIATGADKAFAQQLVSAKGFAGTSEVVVARDPMLYGQSSTPDASRVAKLLDHAIQSFYRSSDPVAPWKKIVHPGQVVGLKVNMLGGPA